MVQSILEGRKTMTRRTNGLKIINTNPGDFQFEWADFILKKPWRFTQKSSVNEISLKERNFNQVAIRCPYGVVGDLLWVRETFMPCAIYDKPIYLYRADGPECYEHIVERMEDQRWVPSIYMPRTASRITLRITDIRVERLNQISNTDAISEGIEVIRETVYKNYVGKDFDSGYYDPRMSFFSLWESINGFGSVELNPWVWVIEFGKVQA